MDKYLPLLVLVFYVLNHKLDGVASDQGKIATGEKLITIGIKCITVGEQYIIWSTITVVVVVG